MLPIPNTEKYKKYKKKKKIIFTQVFHRNKDKWKKVPNVYPRLTSQVSSTVSYYKPCGKAFTPLISPPSRMEKTLG